MATASCLKCFLKVFVESDCAVIAEHAEQEVKPGFSEAPRVPGSVCVIVRPAGRQRGTVWMHENGWNCGLGLRGE